VCYLVLAADARPVFELTGELSLREASRAGRARLDSCHRRTVVAL
jgi:hypothetical protein